MAIKVIANYNLAMSISQKRADEIASIPDEDIDTSDIPEASEEFFRNAELRLSERGAAMNAKPKETPTYLEAKKMLPADLHSAFDDMLMEYRFASFKHHGQEFASPKVIAELILMGWRTSAPPIESKSDND